MVNLEVWELQHGVVMPCLTSIRLEYCPKLKALPALGKLPSLKELDIIGVYELRHIGCEFLYEVDEEAGGEVHFNAAAAFPKLESLTIKGSKELEWEGVTAGSGEKIIMPCLRQLSIPGFLILKPFLEVVSKASSSLEIRGEATEFIKYIRHDDVNLQTTREIMFPNLIELELFDMEDMEELKIRFQVMPLLKDLGISDCNKLKAILQEGGSLSKLESLVLSGGCASLYELPPFPNLKRLEIWKGPIHTSLPEQKC